MKQVYQADDGKCFDTQEECESYEANAEEIQNLYDNLQIWNGKHEWELYADDVYQLAELLHSTYKMERTDWSEL